MSDDPPYSPAVSRHLSRILDQIGLNSLTVSRRRRALLYTENTENLQRNLCGKNITLYHFGSQSEGTTTPGLHSDLDTLLCFHDLVVIQDWADWTRGNQCNMLMLKEETAPGYCRLQLLKSDIPVPQTNLVLEHSTYDISNRVIVKNTIMHSTVNRRDDGPFKKRSGPARTNIARPGFVEEDTVFAYKCDSWPRQADEWGRRPRRGHWPKQELIQQAVASGTFLVPVGYKLSPTEELEWRISTSLAERLLIFSMNMTQIKCYVVLKMIVKSFVTPVVGKSISSYHCKTAVFHCMEEIATELWEESHILSRINQCLSMLLIWVMNGHCPHFIIPEENLFAGKVGVQNKHQLQCILRDLIHSNGRFLLCMLIDDLGQLLHWNLTQPYNTVRLLNTPHTIVATGYVETNKYGGLSILTKDILVENVPLQLRVLIQAVHQKIIFLRGLIRRSHKLKRRAVRTLVQFLSCWLGFIFMSASLSQQKGIPKRALHYIRQGMKTDIASRLKLASAFYCNGEMHKVEMLLREAEVRLRGDSVLVLCKCYDLNMDPTWRFCLQVHDTKSERKRDKLIAFCVRYTPQEIQCAPPGLRHELHRSVGDDAQHRDPVQDRWMVLAVVDCLPYLYYLQYITYRKLGKQDLQTRSLRSLDKCVRGNHDFGHLETAWNLMGQCMELENKQDNAMDCYRTSLEIKPRNNAANWHVQNLLHTQQAVKAC